MGANSTHVAVTVNRLGGLARDGFAPRSGPGCHQPRRLSCLRYRKEFWTEERAESMRVFVAGGTGVLGRRLVPQLVERGHQVTATTTTKAKLGLLRQMGAEGAVMDGLDAASVGEAVAAA